MSLVLKRELDFDTDFFISIHKQYVIVSISNSSLQSKYSLNSVSVFSHQREIEVSESASYE